MCGIAAIIPKANGLGSDEVRERLEQINTCMRHRGPDSEGFYIGDGVGLSMTRLSIVGGDSGQQPIWNEDDSIAIVCNGEIYNHMVLRDSLVSKGHVFTTKSDVEVIVHLYEEYGDHCIERLEGVFAFALWDINHQALLVARDRCGVKPLYYSDADNLFVCASEFQALLSLPGIDTRLDDKGLRAYHTFRFCPAPETAVRGIKKLGGGEYLTIRNGVVSRDTYWTPIPSGSSMNAWVSRGEKTERMKERLIEAVKSQVADEVQSGILLSGGLDSTALLAVYRRVLQQAPDTFTVAFEAPEKGASPSEYTEIEQARAVAKAYGSNHTAGRFTAQEVLRDLPSIIASLDEPIADPTALPLWYAVRMARETGLRVVYSGEGIDELFNGYEVYQQARWLNAMNVIPESVRYGALSVLQRFGWPGQGVLRRSLRPVAEWYQGVGGIFTPDEDVFSKPSSDAWNASDPMDYVRHIIQPVQNESLLTQMSHFDLSAWLPENTLVKSDKISMAHSVELRVPFLNQGVVDFALEMGDEDKIRKGTGKWIVRQALKELVLPEVLQRPKVGFPVPLTAWIYGEWREFVMSRLLDPNAYTYGMYKEHYVEGLFHVPEKHKRRSARLLWAMLSLELWYQLVYVKRVRTASIHQGVVSL